MRSEMLKLIKWRPSPQKVQILFPIRASSDLPKLRKEQKKLPELSQLYPQLVTQYWNEHLATKKQIKAHGFPGSLSTASDFLKCMHGLQNFPRSFKELFDYIKRRRYRRNLISQQFLAKRELVLKPDLAAAHFIVYRGGSIKFFGQPQWIGLGEEKQTLPITYIPGLHIEGINAMGTNLCYVGLHNIRKLQYIKYLSLRGLDEVNDWCLDYVSKEFYATLKHLDISNCKNVTYRGLSCFYRFECLKSLNLEGVPDTPEMKLACLMLLDVMPNLDIKGIDLNVPEKIEPVNVQETKHLSEEIKFTSEDVKSEKPRQISKM